MNQTQNAVAAIVKEKMILTCAVTGKSRITNLKYLTEKADRLGTDLEHLKLFYANRDSLKLLRVGKKIDEIRSALPTEGTLRDLSEADVAEIVRMNGKHSKTVVVVAGA